MAINRYILNPFIHLALVTGILLVAPQWGLATEIPEEDVQILASGPVHEAFAEAVTLDPEEGIWAPMAPPERIEEIPPREKPEGDVQWIPGYWAWDDELNDFIWVSGIWRVAPPGRQWIPGYWNPGPDGYQWISGYWAAADEEEVAYLPEPPESVEIGPNSNAPSPNYVWIPGCWEWYYGRYAWRPGYWAKAQTDWMWVPAHYVWTPRGYVFIRGYWDYTVSHRGVLFAPVYFTPRVSVGFRYWFSPGFAIDLTIFDDALFLRPRYHHYYFGDYYAPKYYKRGIYPWFSLHARRVAYDPIYAHQRWRHRHDNEWEKRLHKNFKDRRGNEGLRPFRHYEPRKEPNHPIKSSQPKRPNFVMPIKRDSNGHTKMDGYRFTPLNEKERKDFSNREKEVRTYREERRKREASRPETSSKPADKTVAPKKERFSKSPIMDRPDRNTKQKKASPKQYKQPQPNPNVEPLKREYDINRGWGKSQNQQKERIQKDEKGNSSMHKDQGAGNRGGRSHDQPQNTDDRRKNEDRRKNGDRGDSGARRWTKR